MTVVHRPAFTEYVWMGWLSTRVNAIQDTLVYTARPMSMSVPLFHAGDDNETFTICSISDFRVTVFFSLFRSIEVVFHNSVITKGRITYWDAQVFKEEVVDV